MKYVVMEVNIGGMMRELPIIFPNILVHANVAEAVLTMKGMEQSRVVSAGSINSMDIGEPNCHDRSTSLGLTSRGAVDDNLIAMHDYIHGIK